MKTYPLSQRTISEFISIIKRPYSVVLDSSDHAHSDSRYSYIGFDPYSVITVSGGGVVQKFRESNEIKRFQEIHSFFQLLCAQWVTEDSSSTQFTGGLIGYMSYESVACFPDFSHLNMRGFNQLPEMIWGIYDRFICIDYSQNKCSLMVRDDVTGCPFTLKMFSEMGDEGESDSFNLTSSVSGPDYDTYESGVKAILEWIRCGHTYQVNFSQRYQASFQGDPLSLYLKLRQFTPSPYAAYLNYPMVQICSMSPELLLSKVGTTVMTRPLKGTIETGCDDQEDRRNQLYLSQSVKDKAELTMIVDLERNDLKRICRAGSITVDDMYRVESFSHVHHLVSDVSGILNEDYSYWALIMALFPGGSITGAPKIRSVELIHALESDPRYVYTGCIGYIGFNGMMKFNIAIRTLYAHNRRVYFHSGSGIVADSDPQKEWMELIAKAKGITAVLEKVRK